jgi:putative ABC transport system permease protein
MEALIQDIGYSLRRLRKAPGFALVAVATLALGIGANAAIFSAVNAVLLRPLPYPDADRLVVVNQVWKGQPVVLSPQNFLDFEAATKSFDALAVYDTDGATLTGRGEPVQLATGETSAAFFDVLGVTPALGRAFRPGENEPGQNRVVVLSQGLWRERFGGDPAAVGQDVILDGVKHAIIGVAPRASTSPAAGRSGGLSNTTSGSARRAGAPGTSRRSGASARRRLSNRRGPRRAPSVRAWPRPIPTRTKAWA